MTTYSLTCTNCLHRIDADTLEELTDKPRTCPVCDRSTWEVSENDGFPISPRSRRELYKAFLHVGQYCITQHPCTENKPCQLQKYCRNGVYWQALAQWILEAE